MMRWESAENCPLCIFCIVLLSSPGFQKTPPDELDAPDDLVPLDVGALVDADAELTDFPLVVLPNFPETVLLRLAGASALFVLVVRRVRGYGFDTTLSAADSIGAFLNVLPFITGILGCSYSAIVFPLANLSVVRDEDDALAIFGA